MKDYSQFGEQAAILAWADGRTGPNVNPANGAMPPGRFLDIGAWDPFTFSNTRALYEKGWRGVMVEPSPAPMLSLVGEYGNDEEMTLVQAAVTTAGDWVDLWVSSDAVSTTSLEQYVKWRDTAKYHGKMVVPSFTVGQLATRFGGFEFVNIDVEGHSVDIFLDMLKNGIMPPCVCVEHDNRTTELLTAATPQHYRTLLVNGTNVVMVR